MVVLNMEAYESLQFESEVYCKLQQAEQEAALTGQRYSSKEGCPRRNEGRYQKEIGR